MAWLRIYEWERNNFGKFQNIKLCRADQEKIIRKLSRHFLAKIYKKHCPYWRTNSYGKSAMKTWIKHYTPRLVDSHRRGGAGRYSARGSKIHCGKTTDLGTIIHEFAHHYTQMKWNECKHNKRFKKTLKMIYKYAEKWYPKLLEKQQIYE